MELFVDGCRRRCDLRPGATVDDVLQDIREDNLHTDRVIVELVCDGIDALNDELDRTLARPASEFERLELHTGVVQEVVAAALEDALDVYEKAGRQRAEVVVLLRQGKTNEAMTLLGPCLSSWHQVNDALAKSVGMLASRIEAVRDQAEQINASFDPLRDLLDRVKQALESQDYVSLSDILEYEFGQAGQRWQDAIRALLRHCGGSGEPPGGA